MAYKNSKGETKYTNVDKMKYHTKCADTGIDGNGQKLTTTQRVRHAMLAEKNRRSVSRYAARADFVSRVSGKKRKF